MEYKLVVSDAAEDDATVAVNYYDEIDIGLGDRFLEELDIIYKKLAAHRTYYSFVHSNRKSDLRDVAFISFPYVVVFWICEDSVQVLQVRNTHRNDK